MEYEVKDRNEWFEEVERAYSKLKIVERPYAPPHAAVAVEAEDVLCCLGLHPHINASDWLVINLDEVSELVELIRPVPVTGATSDGYHTFDELYHHRAVLFSVIVLPVLRRGALDERGLCEDEDVSD